MKGLINSSHSQYFIPAATCLSPIAAAHSFIINIIHILLIGHQRQCSLRLDQSIHAFDMEGFRWDSVRTPWNVSWLLTLPGGRRDPVLRRSLRLHHIRRLRTLFPRRVHADPSGDHHHRRRPALHHRTHWMLRDSAGEPLWTDHGQVDVCVCDLYSSCPVFTRRHVFFLS